MVCFDPSRKWPAFADRSKVIFEIKTYWIAKLIHIHRGANFGSRDLHEEQRQF